MGPRQNHNFRREILVHNAEGKLPEAVFSEVAEEDWQRWGASWIVAIA
jgi:hypothetical protein